MCHRYAELWSPHFIMSLPRTTVEHLPTTWLNERLMFWDRLLWLHDELGGYHHLKIPRRVDVDVQLNGNVQARTGYPIKADPFGNRMIDSHSHYVIQFWCVSVCPVIISLHADADTDACLPKAWRAGLHGCATPRHEMGTEVSVCVSLFPDPPHVCGSYPHVICGRCIHAHTCAPRDPLQQRSPPGVCQRPNAQDGGGASLCLLVGRDHRCDTGVGQQLLGGRRDIHFCQRRTETVFLPDFPACRRMGVNVHAAVPGVQRHPRGLPARTLAPLECTAPG